jgi:hypothetical protein
MTITTFTWADGTSGDWGTGSDWSPNGIPNGTDNASISGVGTETVTVSTNEAVNALTLDDANATLSATNGAQLSVYGGLTATAAQAIDVANGTLLIGGGSQTLDGFTLRLGDAGSGTPDDRHGLADACGPDAGEGSDRQRHERRDQRRQRRGQRR